MADPRPLRLGVNIDHVATIRNARGGDHPDPVKAALTAAAAGADGITAHLREDRRHIRDDDISALMAALAIPLNLEMAATQEMLEIAVRHRPHAACIVPRSEEHTSELQSLMRISYAVFCLKKKKKKQTITKDEHKNKQPHNHKVLANKRKYI